MVKLAAQSAIIPLLLALILLVGCSPVREQSIPDLFSSVLAASLTEDGRVRYAVVAGHPALRQALNAMAEFEADSLASDASRMAFWINAYNAHMLSRVAGQPGRSTVPADDDGAYFWREPVRVAGLDLTLDDIEHAILRRRTDDPSLRALGPQRLDPRIHVAVNCAAVSCPRLWKDAYTAENLDAQLDRAMRSFVNDPAHFDVRSDSLLLSSLLDWYAEDFDLAAPTAGDWLVSYMDPGRPGMPDLAALLRGHSARSLAADPAVIFRYDWTVNRAERP